MQRVKTLLSGRWLDRVLSGAGADIAVDDRQLQVAVALGTVVMVTLACFLLGGQYVLAHSDWRMGVPILATGVTGVALVIQYFLFRNARWLLNGFTVAVAAVEVFNLVTGGLTWAGPVWAVLFPTVMFYIHGLRHGLGVVLSYDLAAAVILFFPGDALLTAYYPGDFKVSLMLALLSISGMSYLLEYSRATAIRQRDAAIDDLDRVAHTDTLTGLPNRRAMDEHLHLEFERYHRHRRSFCIAIADLDFFKRVNDEHGHDVGDDVLRQCATTMRTHVRDVDVVGRWGGEEFLIVMPDTDLTAATAALDRCREAVARKVFLCRDATIRVTVSIGVVRARPDHTLDRLLVEADDRLFEAKDRGRNCVVARGLSGAAPPEDVRREPRTARHHERARA